MMKRQKTAILVLVLVLFVLGTMAAVHASKDKCSDHKDNDHDGYRDGDDPDCQHGGVEGDKHHDQCNDGRDNDGDEHHDSDDKKCSDGDHDEEGENHHHDNDGSQGGTCVEPKTNKNQYNSGMFTYDLGSGPVNVGFSQTGGNPGGVATITDDGSSITLEIKVDPAVKPWLAWGEKPDQNRDGINDGGFTVADLRSDGVFPLDFYDSSSSLLTTYNWKVDPSGPKDLEFSVPSFTDTGMLTGPITYVATIPIPSGYPGTGGQISFSVHISPHNCPEPPRNEIPEYPTAAIPVAVAAMGYLLIRRQRQG